jgi:hypothetical protein
MANPCQWNPPEGRFASGLENDLMAAMGVKSGGGEEIMLEGADVAVEAISELDGRWEIAFLPECPQPGWRRVSRHVSVEEKFAFSSCQKQQGLAISGDLD